MKKSFYVLVLFLVLLFGVFALNGCKPGNSKGENPKQGDSKGLSYELSDPNLQAVFRTVSKTLNQK